MNPASVFCDILVADFPDFLFGDPCRPIDRQPEVFGREKCSVPNYVFGGAILIAVGKKSRNLLTGTRFKSRNELSLRKESADDLE